MLHYFSEWLRALLFLPKQASTVAADVDVLHFTVILASMFGALAILAVAILFCVRYRQQAPRRSDEHKTKAPTPPLWAEISLIAGLFLLFGGWWAWGYWQYIELSTPPADTYDIYVSGKQWMWKFAYPEGQHTIHTVYVPAHRPIRFILTSRDVIHSFYVPDFRIKQDAVPGRYTTVWLNAKEPGTHKILCSEYCGTWHSRMQGQVVALSPTDFSRWLQAGRSEGSYALDPDLPPTAAADSSLAKRGQALAASYGCLRCHSVDGSPHIGPSWLGVYGARVPLQGADHVVADVAYLTESMMDPLAKIHRGYSAIMPSYFGYLQPAEVGALVEYIKALKAPLRDDATLAPMPLPDAGVYRVPLLPPPSQPQETQP